jgi:antitoxin component HigA of HigAB toxin-antitoxin module
MTGSTLGRYSMATAIKPIRTEADYDAALTEVERLRALSVVRDFGTVEVLS